MGKPRYEDVAPGLLVLLYGSRVASQMHSAFYDVAFALDGNDQKIALVLARAIGPDTYR